MGGTMNHDDLVIADALARQTFQGRALFDKQLQEQKMNTYEKQVIKNFMNVEYGSGASIEQLITAQGYFGAVVAQVKANGHGVPSDLATALEVTTRDLNEKLRVKRLAEIKTLEYQLEQLLTADQKREKIESELSKLRELVK